MCTLPRDIPKLALLALLAFSSQSRKAEAGVRSSASTRHRCEQRLLAPGRVAQKRSLDRPFKDALCTDLGIEQIFRAFGRILC